MIFVKTTITFSLLIFGWLGSGALASHETPLKSDDEAFILNMRVRIASFNVSLYRSNAGELINDLKVKTNPQAKAVAEIIQRVQPDILLLNEFDYDPNGEAIELFQSNYLEVGQKGAGAAMFPYVFLAPSNTGVASGHDLNNDGINGKSGNEYGSDALGYGLFPGQYGMVILSKYPILARESRTFQRFLWKDMPNALLPDNLNTPKAKDWYNEEELKVFRLSSKNHWDVPVNIHGRRLHLLASHPTPSGFDGLEDRNGKRNHDEIRFWADYISGGYQSDYIVDDRGVKGGLTRHARFVILGDLNADPYDGNSTNNPMRLLMNHPRVNVRFPPASEGSAEAALEQGLANMKHIGNRSTDTSDFNDNRSGNLRVDYALPSENLRMVNSGVFWPKRNDPLYRLVGDGVVSSDHRMVWVDIQW